LKTKYQLIVPTACGRDLVLRWASVLHLEHLKHTQTFFFREHPGAMAFLRGIVRQFQFDEADIASSPDTIAAVLLWLCSVILQNGQGMTPDQLKPVCSHITIRRAVNQILKQVNFLQRLIDYELPPEYSPICTSLFNASVDSRLVLVGKKKVKNCKRKRE